MTGPSGPGEPDRHPVRPTHMERTRPPGPTTCPPPSVSSRGVRRALAATAVTGLAVVPLVGLTPSAHALSCVPLDEVAPGAAHLFTGRVTDSDEDRLLVRVVGARPGDVTTRDVWVRISMPEWMPWAPTPGAEGHGMLDGVPEDYSDDRLWLFAADRNWDVNPCSSWVLSDFDGPDVQALVDALEPVRATGRVPGGAPEDALGTSSEHTPAQLGAAAAGGVGLGALVLAGAAVRNRRSRTSK